MTHKTNLSRTPTLPMLKGTNPSHPSLPQSSRTIKKKRSNNLLWTEFQQAAALKDRKKLKESKNSPTHNPLKSLSMRRRERRIQKNDDHNLFYLSIPPSLII